MRIGDAGKIATVLYEHGKRPLTDDLRNRLGVRASALGLETIKPYFGSLEKDPIHPEVFYLCVDGIDNVPLLMRFAPSFSPSSGLFPKAILIGRLRVGSQETVINALPFGPTDAERIRTFAWEVSTVFIPKVQGSKSTISAPVAPGVFGHFRAIAKPLSLNVAAVRGDFDTILWEAIRSGWREGYSAESDDTAAVGYSRYILTAGDDLLARLEAVARARVPLKLGRLFDWELRLEEGVAPETAQKIIEDCRAAGKPPQFIGFASGKALAAEEWLALGRRQSVGFSFWGLDDQPEVLDSTAKSLNGRFTYRAGIGTDPQALAKALFG